MSGEHVDTVVQVLLSSLSSDAPTREGAGAMLLEYLKTPGYGSILAEIISRKGAVHDDIRMQASFNLRLLVRQHWGNQNDADYLVNDEEKAVLRQQVSSLLGPDRPEIITALGMGIASMAKWDFPHIWPDLISNVLEALSQTEHYASFLPTLFSIVKCIITLQHAPEYSEFDGETEITRAYDEKWDALRAHAPSIVMQIVPLWGSLTQKLMTQIQVALDSGQALSSTVDPEIPYDCLMCFKIIQLLLRSYLPSLHAANPSFFQEFCTMLANRLEAFSQLIRSGHTFNGIQHLIRLTTKMIKFIVDIQEEHPLTFVPVLLSFLHFVLKEFLDWNDEWRGIPHFEAALIYYTTFLSNVLGTRCYQEKYLSEAKIAHPTDPDVEIPTAEAVSTGIHIVDTFFTPASLIGLLQTVVGRWLKIQENRLCVWEDSPDVYFEEDLSTSVFSIQYAADNLLFRIIHRDESLICGEIMRMLHAVRQNCAKPNPEEVSTEDILLKEACTSLLHLTANSLCVNNIIDYETIQEEIILPDLSNPDPRYKILRKTFTRIIACWSDDMQADSHKGAWEILVQLLGDPDVLVRFFSLRAIKDLLSSVDLDYEPYGSCIKPTMELLLAFLNDMKSTSFLQLILEETHHLIHHLKDRMAAFTEPLVAQLNEYWGLADLRGQKSLKQPIVTILANLCAYLPDYRPIYETFISVMDNCTDLDHPDSELLLEPGMRLWWNIVQTSDHMSDELVRFFPRALHIYTKVPKTSHITSMAIRLLDSYIILGGEQFCHQTASQIVELIEAITASCERDLVSAAIDLMLTFILVCPNDAPLALFSSLARIYHIIFYKYSHRTRILIKSCNLFMQILHKNQHALFQFLSEPTLNQSRGIFDANAPPPLTRVISRFFDLLPHVDLIEPEKIWVCGFSVLFSNVSNPIVMQYAPNILDAIVSLFTLLEKQLSSTRSTHDSKEHSDFVTIEGSTVDIMRRSLRKNDISKAPLDHIKNYSSELIFQTLQAGGPDFSQSLASAVKPETKKWLNL